MIASMVHNQPLPVRQESTPAAGWDDAQLVAELRRGNEMAFEMLVERYHLSLIRVAQHYVSSHALAEEVAQETWLGVLQGLQRFEGRASLRTWIFHILTNRAKTRGQREGRSVPFSALEKMTDVRIQRSNNCRGRDSGGGRSAGLVVGQHEHELGDLRRGQRRGVQVLHDK